MQPNTITLAVDELNNGTTVNEVLTRYEENLNRSTYIGENHTVAARDTLTFYRTTPKQSGNFRGTSKAAVKFSRDVAVAGVDETTTVKAPFIMETSFSIPVGVTEADMILFCQRNIALLDQNSIMAALLNQLMI